jgi:hypothetical protein
VTARRTGIPAGLLLAGLLAGAESLRAAPPIEADPHDLFEAAGERLSAGDLKGCAATIARLQVLIARRPEWDPEGTFSGDLLPPLLSRLGRLEGAAVRLDGFTGRALLDLKPPEPGPDMDTVKDYTRWAAAVIRRLRAERDDIVRAALADPGERALLSRTESYARTERLLEVEVLTKLAEGAGDDVLGLLTGNPEIEAVLVRFRQLKRELIQTAAERDRLRGSAREAGEASGALLDALAAVLTGGASAAKHDGLRSSFDRYARSNQALLAAGIGSDQSGSIRALAQAVEEIPARPGPVAAPPAPGRMSAPIAFVLVVCAGLLSWIAIARVRLRGAPRRPGPPSVRGVEVPPGGAGAGRDAA